jgi:hypothetical protein
MLTKCTLDDLGRNIWLSFQGSPIRIILRYRTNAKPPSPILDLDGRSMPIANVFALLPRLKASDFKVTSSTQPELRADVDGWHVCILMGSTPFGALAKAGAIAAMETWAAEHIGRGKAQPLN